MTKLNTLQYPNVQNMHISSDLSLSILENNEVFEKLKKEFKTKYSFNNLNTFSNSKDGFLGLFLQLSKKGKIAVSHGESYSIIEAAKTYETLGFELVWIDLQKDGRINLKQIETLDVDFIFISSYIMDTFVKTNLDEIKQKTNAKIISNASADFSDFSDVVYFDSYKLTGFALSSVL
ncbi:MAG: cysteine desulfurase, partial [Poseidonibacter sp.]